MIDRTIIDDDATAGAANIGVIAMAPAVSVGSNMLALAASTARDYSNATNQQQLNNMISMVAAMQNCGAVRSLSDTRALDEAMTLLRQVLAAVQAN